MSDSATRSVTRPRTVSWALRLLYAGVVLSVIKIPAVLAARDAIREGFTAHTPRAHPNTTSADIDDATTSTVVVLIGIAGISALAVAILGLFIARGAWWSRIVMTVLALLGILLAWSAVTRSHAPAYYIAVELTLMTVTVVGTALLWHRASGPHFAGPSSPSAGASSP